MKKIISIILSIIIVISCVTMVSALYKGDVDQSGKISAIDARLTLRCVAGLEILSSEQEKIADVDGNDVITAVDARYILRIVAGLESPIEYKEENGSSGSTYYPSIPDIGTTVKPDSSGTSIEDKFNHFLTCFDTPEEREAVLKLVGYEYDAEQDIFYTNLNPWQRYFNFIDVYEYEDVSMLSNMNYLTLKADFIYDDLLWRLQWWKGQYGVLEGAELGVYTKSPYDNSGFYKCAEGEQLLKMVLDYYHSWEHYKNGNRLFTRAEQEHWWLTGFKFGVVSPKKCVVRATLYAYDDEMADGIEAALQNLTDGNNKLTGKGFVPYKSGVTQRDFYIRNGNRFSVVWCEAGYINDCTEGNIPENPEAENVNLDLSF